MSGSQRIARIWQAVRDGAEGPPLDLRFVAQPRVKVAGETACAKVASFLESLYHSTAETLPDVREDGVVLTTHEGEDLTCDAYAESVGACPLGARPGASSSKRPRKRKMNLEVHPERSAEHMDREVRFLPPGCMRDHWEAMAAIERVSFKVFWKTWVTEFPFLKFRATSNHSQCSTCVRYKLLIRGLANHLAARQRQAEILADHLKSQYRDRLSYWSLRGQARLGCTHIVCILDGMDQCKFCVPRSRICAAKDLAGLQRPKLHVCGCIVHGWGLCFFVSNADMPKDSSYMVEAMNIVLSLVKRSGIDTSKAHFHLQSDNTPREVKNSTFLRWMSLITSRGPLGVNVQSNFGHVNQICVFGTWVFAPHSAGLVSSAILNISWSC